MDAAQIQRLRPMLDRYLRGFDDCFGRRELPERTRVYVLGQLSDLQRKSIEPMADAAGLPPRTLQQFLSRHRWDERRMRDTLEQIIARDHRHPCSIGIFDETGHAKKGQKTPGVQRQWCGATGKTDNCTVTVHLGYAAGEFHCLLDSELYLPESWSADRQRCRQAAIPEQMVYRAKWQIALDLWARAVANGVRFEWLIFDENYGGKPGLLFALDDRGQRYVAEVPATFTGWLVDPQILRKEHHRKFGRPRRFPRLKAKSPSASYLRDLLRHSPILREVPWERFHVKDTRKGPMVWQAKAARFHLKRNGLPSWPHWLIVAHNVETPDEVKYFVSNAPEGAPLEVLLHVAFSRWHVERCFEDEKGQLGLSDFEVRNYRSLRRHLALTAVSHLFLAKVHQQWRGEKSRADGLPTPQSLLGPGAVPVADRNRPRRTAAANGPNHHANPATTGAITSQPRQDKAKAIARNGHRSGQVTLLHPNGRSGVVVIDGHCFLFVDGQLRLELLDPDPIDSVQSSGVGFEAYQSMIRVSDLIVRQIVWQPREQSYPGEF